MPWDLLIEKLFEFGLLGVILGILIYLLVQAFKWTAKEIIIKIRDKALEALGAITSTQQRIVQELGELRLRSESMEHNFDRLATVDVPKINTIDSKIDTHMSDCGESKKKLGEILSNTKEVHGKLDRILEEVKK